MKITAILNGHILMIKTGLCDDASAHYPIGFYISVNAYTMQCCWVPRLWHWGMEGRSQNWHWRRGLGCITFGRQLP